MTTIDSQEAHDATAGFPPPVDGTPTAQTRPQTDPAPDGEDETEPSAREPKRNRRGKISKWDREPPPKDWRFFVGGLGRVLITIGLLMFGFVAYQLWGTGIETAAAQNELGQQFEQTLASVPPVSAAPDVSETIEPTIETTAPAAEAVATTTPDEPTIEADDPKITKVVPASKQKNLNENIQPGDAIMKIEIPKIGVKAYVLPGVSRADLKRGVGHFPDSPWAGQLGNASFAGHRTTYGAPFYDLDKLIAGDRVMVTRRDGNRYVYQVTDTVVVKPEEYYVVTTQKPTVATITLTTCTPKGTAEFRMAVNGVLVPEESGPVGAATFYDPPAPAQQAAPATTQPTQTTADGTAVDTVSTTDPDTDAAAPETAAPATTPSATTPSATTPSATPTTVAVAEPTASDSGEPDRASADFTDAAGPSSHAEDAFVAGWFSDDAAWPQIALWGTALFAIALIGRAISRKTRHDSVGFIVSVAPFVVALYFFYQNVNRMLPAGL